MSPPPAASTNPPSPDGCGSPPTTSARLPVSRASLSTSYARTYSGLPNPRKLHEGHRQHGRGVRRDDGGAGPGVGLLMDGQDLWYRDVLAEQASERDRAAVRAAIAIVLLSVANAAGLILFVSLMVKVFLR
jgi:hypothetical protein